MSEEGRKDVHFSFEKAKPWFRYENTCQSVVELGVGLVKGEVIADNVQAPYPMGCLGPLEEVQEGLAFIPFFGNVTVLDTSEGLVMIDGGGLAARIVYNQIRNWRPDSPFHTGIYTHGHIDHVHGIKAIEKYENLKMRVVGHRNVSKRFERYSETRKLNATINFRQFQSPSVGWPRTYRYPDLQYDDHLQLDIGGEELHLYHDRGETDDATWVWIPKRAVLCTGDLFIWSFPNCGNPQKSQRYCQEWAAALRKMEKFNAQILLPGHGPPIQGKELVKQVLHDSAFVLESVFQQTMRCMNSGMRLEDVVRSVTVPEELLSKPYLRPQYDQIDFVVRNIWRLHAGWWDGNPSHLEPVHDTILAKEIIQLVGGTTVVQRRIEDLLLQQTRDSLAIASHFAEYLLLVEPSQETKDLYEKVYTLRANQAESTMATGIYSYSAATVTPKQEEFKQILSKI